jgi:hypothetical protein
MGSEKHDDSTVFVYLDQWKSPVKATAFLRYVTTLKRNVCIAFIGRSILSWLIAFFILRETFIKDVKWFKSAAQADTWVRKKACRHK